MLQIKRQFLSLLLVAAAYKQACLPDAVTPDAWKNIEVAGRSRPIGIWQYSWPSSQLLSSLYHTLVSEVLGFNVSYSGLGTSSATGLYALAGCADPANYHTDAKCYERTNGEHDLAFEIWKVSIADRLKELQSFVGDDSMPVMLGDCGYTGVETIFVLKQAFSQAYQQQGLSLDFYRSYDPAWKDTSPYFGSWTEIDISELRPCSETLLFNHDDMVNYLKFTSDYEGIQDDEPGGMHARCWNQAWWLSPACRTNPQKCVPIITGGNGWMLYAIMQTSATWQLPWAVATAADWQKYTTVPREYGTMLYWWKPDQTFIELQPKPVVFPSISEQLWSDGDKSGILMEADLLKYVRADFPRAALPASDLAEKMSLSDKEIDDLLNELKVLNDVDTVACQWLRSNKDVWINWIPLESSCQEGMGMADVGSLFVTTRAAAKGCVWCTPGHASEPLRDEFGITHVCRPCRHGEYQDMPGQSTCSKCSKGSFSDVEGSLACMPCGIGSFQNETGQSMCSACPPLLTTRSQSSIWEDDCVCSSGTFAVASGACQACPEGMTCDLGSREEATPCAKAPGPWPRPDPGFWTSCSDPLKAYKCVPASICPGHLPEQCAENFEALACGRCKLNNVKTNGRCLPCPQEEALLLRTTFGAVIIGLSIVTIHALSSRQRRPSRWSALVSAAAVTLWFYQMLALQTDDAEDLNAWDLDLDYLLDPFFALMSLQCGSFAGFASAFYARLLMPMALGIYFVVLYTTWNFIVTRTSLAGHWKMDWQEGVSNYGSSFLILFIIIARQALSLFQCYPHPGNHSMSLLSSPDILCFNSEWWSLAAPACLAVAVFCGGSLSVICSVLHSAPARMHQRSFRRCWRFIFIRFRPVSSWWSLVLLMRGVLLSMPRLIFSNPVSQLLLLLVIALLYALLCLLFKPWHSLTVTILDVTTCGILVVHAALAAGYQIPGPAESEGLSSLVVALWMIPSLLAFIGWVSILLSKRPRQAYLNTLESEFSPTLQKLTGETELLKTLEHLPTHDLQCLIATLRILANCMESPPKTDASMSMEAWESQVAASLAGNLGSSPSFAQAAAAGWEGEPREPRPSTFAQVVPDN